MNKRNTASDVPMINNHGNSKAGWALTWIALAGSLISTVGAIIPNHTIVYVGIGVIALGGIVGLVLKNMGYGAYGSKTHKSS